MLVLPPSKAAKIVADSAASFAIEDLYFDDEFLRKMMLLAEGKMDVDAAVKEIVDRHKKAPPE